MELNSNTQPDADIQRLLDGLYWEVVGMRIDFWKRKRKGEKNLDEVKATADDLDEDFQSLAKTHTIYLRLQKAGGVRNTNHSADMIKKINEIKVNIGNIVRDVPKS